MNKSRVLIVEDEPETVKFVSANLQARGYEVAAAGDGRTALRMFQESASDLIILDISLPDMDGFQICQTLRRQSNVPIVILSARWQEQEIVRALDMGADDYLAKPFGVDELLARIRLALRHGPSKAQPFFPDLTILEMKIDFEARIVSMKGRSVALTRIEFDLLAYLAQNAGRILTHQALLQAVWGPEYSNEIEYLWTYIKRLRHKIEPDPHNPRYILTHAGVGYSCASPI